MGISISIPCDACINKVFYWLEKKVGYIRNLKKNLVALEKDMEELKAKRVDNLSRNFSRAEDVGLERPAQFQVWLNDVETVEQKVNDLLSDRAVQLQRRCLCGFCSKNPKSGYHYGKKVFMMLREVEELKTRVFDVIAEQAQTRVVQERSIPPIIVGQETMLDKAWNHLMEDGVGIMGMYGMGGVGKTTLLTQINNKFSNDSRGFDYVLWVVVSKELNVEKIQNEIAQKVGLGGGDWKQKEQSEKIDDIYNFLKRKKFVLLLDDIWEKVDLREIGVPFPTIQNRCKVAFTTRSQDVCARMGVTDSMEVKCLMDNVAFDLFQKRVGQKTLDCDPGIPDLARTIARKCCGLPLALNVIGETMSCKKTIQEWRNAIDVLNSYAAEFDGMDNILPLLKYSYDSLKGEHIKSCLLYCALYPEDAKILKKELIEYWICEEIIDGSEGIERAEDKGYEIIGSLARASLLMEWDDGLGRGLVRMHDVVREMALWIASELGIQKEAFIVRAGVGLRDFPKVKNWNAVRRMSLMENKIHHLVGGSECMELTTLLLGNGEYRNISSGLIEMISSEFFNYMPKLAVLDLSYNERLSELPEGISNLVSLQYLNLSNTGTRRLPIKGLQELKKLIHLDLEYTYLESIAGISSLYNLKVLKLRGSVFPWDFDIVKELESLEHLEILTATINPGMEPFLSSHRLMSRSQFLWIHGEYVFSHNRYLESFEISLSGTMDKLRDFMIDRCIISEIKMGRICSFLTLVKVYIINCESLRELTFLIFAPNLRKLYVSGAKDLEDIIKKEKACEGENSGIVLFQKLKDLILSDLRKLKNIYWSPLPFPCLQKVEVRGCQNLRKLPLNSESGKQGDNGLVITYSETSWIEGVEWADEATKLRFLSSCIKEEDPYGFDNVVILV